MPIYEYHCPECSHEFERLLPNARAKAKCPQCGHAKPEKRFSAFAAHAHVNAAPCQSGSCPSARAASSCGGAGKCPLA